VATAAVRQTTRSWLIQAMGLIAVEGKGGGERDDVDGIRTRAREAVMQRHDGGGASVPNGDGASVSSCTG
jgi:hypothetical protein